MTPERWKVVSPHFDKILAMDQEGVSAYLAQTAQSDPDLKADISSLLGTPNGDVASGIIEPAMWPAISQVLDHVMRMDSASQKAYLDKLTKHALRLKLQVTTLLESEDESPTIDFLEEPPIHSIQDNGGSTVTLSDTAKDPPKPYKDPFVGSTIHEYEVLGVAGRGGMGVVYRAWDTNLQRTVALKMMTPQLAEDQEFKRRFRNGARILGKLNDPRIVTVHGLRTTETSVFIVLEFVEGETLKERIKREGPMPWDQARPIFLDLLEALGHVHRAGVLHRDLKSSNVMISNTGGLKLMDFGLGRSDTNYSNTMTSGVAGSPPYMPPEQFSGLGHVDVRSDLYGIGMILYEAMAGKLPFDPRANAFDIKDLVLEGAIPPPNSLNAEVPVGVNEIVLKAIASDPNDRYQTAGDLAEAIAGVCDKSGPVETLSDEEPVSPGLTPVAESSPTPSRVAPVRTGRKVAMAMATSGVLLVLLSAFLLRPATLDLYVIPGGQLFVNGEEREGEVTLWNRRDVAIRCVYNDNTYDVTINLAAGEERMISCTNRSKYTVRTFDNGNQAVDPTIVRVAGRHVGLADSLELESGVHEISASDPNYLLTKVEVAGNTIESRPSSSISIKTGLSLSDPVRRINIWVSKATEHYGAATIVVVRNSDSPVMVNGVASDTTLVPATLPFTISCSLDSSEYEEEWTLSPDQFEAVACNRTRLVKVEAFDVRGRPLERTAVQLAGLTPGRDGLVEAPMGTRLVQLTGEMRLRLAVFDGDTLEVQPRSASIDIAHAFSRDPAILKLIVEREEKRPVAGAKIRLSSRPPGPILVNGTNRSGEVDVEPGVPVTVKCGEGRVARESQFVLRPGQTLNIECVFERLVTLGLRDARTGKELFSGQVRVDDVILQPEWYKLPIPTGVRKVSARLQGYRLDRATVSGVTTIAEDGSVRASLKPVLGDEDAEIRIVLFMEPLE